MSRKQLSLSSHAPSPGRRGHDDAGKSASSLAGNRDLLTSLGGGQALPDAVRGKMESSFGADLSSVRLHESPLVAQGGAEAAASGSHVAFAPGKLDFSSRSGLELLGHELSHVVSQSKGEVSGRGVVHDGALERRADAEGAKAAAGGGELVPMGPGLVESQGTGAVQCRKKSKGEKFTEGINSMDNLSDKVDAMRGMAHVSSVDPDMDNTEADAYFDLIGGFDDHATLDEIFKQRLSSAQELMSHRAALEKDGLSGPELDFRTKYSPQANHLLSFNSLLKDIGMSSKKDDIFSYSTGLAQELKESDPEAFAMMDTAGNLLSTNDNKASAVMGADVTAALKEADQEEALSNARTWKRPSKWKRWRGGR